MCVCVHMYILLASKERSGERNKEKKGGGEILHAVPLGTSAIQ